MVDLIEYSGWIDFGDNERAGEQAVGATAANRSTGGTDAHDDVAGIFGGFGFLTILGEKIPLVNSGLQQLHQLVGDEAAYRRAQQQDPIGPNGYLTQAAEHVPLLNNVLQEVFKNMGDDGAFRRAKARDPIGTHGYLTQAFEQFPVISDGVMMFHRFQGEEDAYERARAHSLQNLLSKDGAITRLAEVMPGSNIIAAVLHKMNGNDEEAARAMGLVESWAQVFTPDSPFARIFELIPGPDALAFALHVQGGYYAQALRSLAKTSWVTVSIDKVGFIMRCPALSSASCWGLNVESVVMQPMQFSLIVGMRDMLTNFLVVDTAGQRRDGAMETDFEQIGEKFGAFEYTKELVKRVANDQLSTQISSFANDLPEYLDWMVLAINRRMPGWRSQSNFMRRAFPEVMPPLTELVKKEFQRALPRASIRHVPLSDFRPNSARLRRWQHAGLVAESASVAGCFSLLGGLGMSAPAGGLLCFAGLAFGAVEFGKAAMRRTARWLDAWNADSWTDVVEDPQPRWSWQGATGGRATSSSAGVAAKGSKISSSSNSSGSSTCASSPSSSCSSASSSSTATPGPSTPPISGSGAPIAREERHGVILELMSEDATRLGRLVRAYYLREALAVGAARAREGLSRRARALLAAEPALRWLARRVFDTKDAIVPFVMEIEMEAWAMELAGFSFDAWVPSMRFAVVLHLDMTGGAPTTQRVFMVLPDALVGNVVSCFQEQIPTWDLRELDQRFAGFQKPAYANLEHLDLRWSGPSGFELEARGVRCRLDLPR